MSDTQIRDWWEELFQVHEFAHYRDYAENLTRGEVDFLAQALGLRGVETILDLACGGGRHSLELARRGFTVVGLDAVAPVLADARRRAAEEGLSVEFVQGDMRALSYEARFDTVLVMNSSLGFFEDTVNRETLQRIAGALVDGGKLLIQCLNPYQIASYLQGFRNGWHPLAGGYLLRDAHFEPRTATLHIDYRFVLPQHGVDAKHPGDRIRLYGYPELTAMLRSVGLRPTAVFGDAVMPSVPFEEDSQWQVIVAVKS